MRDRKDDIMDENLNKLLDGIYRNGQKHDSHNNVHEERMLNITPDTGTFLSILIQSSKARNILEIGTSNGYSTIWIADAVSRNGGNVTTLEVSKAKHETANRNFQESGLEKHISSILMDVRDFVKSVPSGSIDFIFLDAERPQYKDYWGDLDRILKPNGLLVVDNAISPKPEEMAEIKELIGDSGRYISQVVDIGKGELVSLKIYNA